VTILKEVSVSVHEHARIGVVGKNGAGKSTLLRVLAGEKPKKGAIEISGKVVYIPQLVMGEDSLDVTVGQYLERVGGKLHEVRAYLHRHMPHIVLSAERHLHDLSGGELAALQLSAALLQKPDVLLLDEPTNHLDVTGLVMLKKILADIQCAVVLASHDEYFLDEVAEEIWFVEEGAVRIYGGNYTHFVTQKKHEDDAAQRAHKSAVQKLKTARDRYQTEQHRADRSYTEGLQVKRQSSMSSIERGFFNDEATFSYGQRRMGHLKKMKDLEEEVVTTALEKKRPLRVSLDSTEHKGRQLLEVTDATLTLGSRSLAHIEKLKIRSFQCTVIVGKNGSGKSALVRALCGMGPAKLTGAVLNEVTTFAYLDQHYRSLEANLTLLQLMKKEHSMLSETELRRQLGRYLFFDEEVVHGRVGDLSGGEMARLTYALATAKPLDMLVLDEPTNNIDIETSHILAEALVDFPGALVVVSHNVAFLDAIGGDVVYGFKDAQLVELSVSAHDRELFVEAVAAL
jgi:ATPase subunit of ABC transporter with duplicated ATPase domains